MAKNRRYASIRIESADEVNVHLRGDIIQLEDHGFSVFVSIEEFNKMVEKIGRKMVEQIPQKVNI